MSAWRQRTLVAVFLLALGAVVARLAQIQLHERELWAGQAAAMTSETRVVPAHRGTIYTRDMAVLAEDEERWQVEWIQRDWRRGSALGQAAHAWSALHGRGVGYLEAWSTGALAATRLLECSPAELDAWAQGAALERLGLDASAEPRLEWRSSRASDVRFYALRLLEATREEERAVRLLRREGPVRETWLELVARMRGVEPGALRESVERRFAREARQFAALAQRIDSDGLSLRGEEEVDASAASSGGAPEERLLARMQALREAREDAQADAMFALALGFEPSRLPTRVLVEELDTRFLARALRFDDARHARWLAGRAARRREEVAGVLVPRALARAANERDERAMERSLLDSLARMVAAGGDAGAVAREGWRALEEPSVLRALDECLEGDPCDRDGLPMAGLPFVDEDWRDLAADALADESTPPWTALALLEAFAVNPLVDARAVPSLDESRERWSAIAQSARGLEGPDGVEACLRIATTLEDRHDEAVERLFARGCEPGDGPRSIQPARVARALQHESYLGVDLASRPAVFLGEPSYELVHALVRDRRAHPGFEVREVMRRRRPAADANGTPLASALLGRVGRPSLRELLAFEGVDGVVGRRAREAEWVGRSGIEAWLDTALRGSFGVHEVEGLAERARPSRVASSAPRDGAEVVLTIDARLQIAAQETLAHPVPPPLGDDTDALWFEHPVGAIILCDVDGAVLAAASEPGVDGLAPAPGRGPARSSARERVFHRPVFNPPGSVFKPFVAAWALDHLSFDEKRSLPCTGRFDSIACNGVHSACDLRRALVVSCNSYFAQMGLEYPPEGLLRMAREFGFGAPTGAFDVAGFGAGDAREDWSLHAGLSDAKVLDRLGARFDRVRFPNGLQVVEATPAQVARAMCGLATGVLPELRVVASIGGRETPVRGRALAIEDSALGFVRAAMEGVVEDPSGSAHGKGLDERTLGFRLAAKTGSADIGPIREHPGLSAADRADKQAGKQRKHAWIGGWFPAERPRFVVVAYLCDTTETAGRTAAFVVAQFLRHEAVRALVEDARQ
jgi:penicillin-binding protein 2